MRMTSTAQSTKVAATRRAGDGVGADLTMLAVQAVLVGCAVIVGAYLNHRRVPIHADAAPLFATWLPHVGPGTPVAIAIAVLVVYWGPAWAARLRWRRLLVGGYLMALAWTLSRSLGRDAALDAMRAGPQPSAVPRVFRRVGAEPTLAVFGVTNAIPRPS